MKFTIPFFISLSFSLALSAQKKNENYQLHIHQASSPIKIDGVMDEQAWKDAALATDFRMVLPMDTSLAQVKTDVRMTYDDNNLYIIADCYNGVSGVDMVESMRRDFSFKCGHNCPSFFANIENLSMSAPTVPHSHLNVNVIV